MNIFRKSDLDLREKIIALKSENIKLQKELLKRIKVNECLNQKIQFLTDNNLDVGLIIPADAVEGQKDIASGKNWNKVTNK